MSITVNDYGYVIKVTGTATAAEVVTNNFLHLGGIYWKQPTTAGHLLSLTDKSDQGLAKAYAEANNQSVWLDVDNQPVNGLKIDDMDSGEVYIYVRKGRYQAS